MGAIFGVYDPDGPDPAWLPAMASRHRHRGHGPTGSWAQGPIALAFRSRRADLVPSQPAAEGHSAAVLDGWVYDHELLAEEAGAEPGATDTLSVLRAWNRHGRHTPDRIDGDFALALWHDGQLHLVRDALGVRPLFVARSGRRVGFASEPAVLFALPWVSKRLDPSALGEYLSFQVVHAPRTLLAGIEQVEPGSLLQIGPHGVTSRTWWSPRHARPDARQPAAADLVEVLQQAVGQAVTRRLPREGRAGLYLSGGLGSTAIAVAARSQGVQLPTFTVALDDDPHPELPIAGRVAHLLGLTDHREVVVGSLDVAAHFEAAVACLPMPVGHPSAVLHALLAREAAQQVAVGLSGDGGDELFGGRILDGVSRALAVGRAVGALPGPLRSALARALPLGERHRDALVDPDRWPLRMGLGGHSLFDDGERLALLRDPALAAPGVRPRVLAPFYQDLVTDPINAVLYGSLRSWLAEGALPVAERTAAAAGLDLRFPLLDRSVLRAAAAVPGRAKGPRGALSTRWPLRALLHGVLPTALVDRPKRGLPTGLTTWLSGEGRLFFEDHFRRLGEDPQGWYKRGELARLRRTLRGRPDIGARVWALFVLDAWWRSLPPD